MKQASYFFFIFHLTTYSEKKEIIIICGTTIKDQILLVRIRWQRFEVECFESA